MGARGDRIAEDKPARRDAGGHSPASDVFMYFVAVELCCERCERKGVNTVLGAWAVETRDAKFSPDPVFERGENSAVEPQVIPSDDGQGRVRFQFRCPRCGSAPEYREEKTDEALATVYVQGARAVTHHVLI